MEDLGSITQEEALRAVLKYKNDEMLELIREAITLKRQDEVQKKADENQLKLNLEEEKK